MTVNQIMRALISSAAEEWENTCDGLIAGDGEREVKKIAVCFKGTAETIRLAAQHGADLLIVHEPVFYGNEGRGCDADPITLKKWEMIDSCGIAICRFHDHAHLHDPDFIHEGFIRSLGLDIESKYPIQSLGIRRYVLFQPVLLTELVGKISDKLDISHVRIVGDTGITVKTVCLGLGSVGVDNIKILTRSDTDLFITGELDEVCGCEYLRDAVHFGMKKALLLLGHCGAEYAGMRYLAECMKETFPDIETEYLHCGEVYI